MSENNANEEIDKAQPKYKWDLSMVIAIIAVLISTISTFIGIKESQIMLEQQKITLEQQAASAWPYLENIPINNYEGDTKSTFQFVVENKGVGPAIIDSVKYEFQGKEITAWNLGNELSKKYPTLKISQLQNAVLDGRVLSPGETHSVIKVRIEKAENDTIKLSQVLNNINFNLSYCYCSIYGKCWQITDNKKRKVSELCSLSESIK